MHFLIENYAPKKKKNRGKGDKGEKEGKKEELEKKREEAKIMVPGTGGI